MSNNALPQPGSKPLVLTKRDEDILRAVAYYRYMTVDDLCRLLGYAYPASRKYVGKMLARLAGGDDYVERSNLFRFPMPDVRAGNSQRIYTLGAQGRSYLQDLGMEIDWYFRPKSTAELTYSHLLHPLALTRFLVAAQTLVRTHPEIQLTHMKIEYELRRDALEVMVTLPNKAGKQQEVPIPVVPDAWLDFFLSLQTNPTLPILVEIDRGTEQQQKFKEHIATRLAYVRRGGAYFQQFNTEYVTIAYATTGSEQRVRTMLAWTEEVMRDLQKQHFSELFHFTSLPEGELDPERLFLQPVWHVPFQRQLATLLA